MSEHAELVEDIPIRFVTNMGGKLVEVVQAVKVDELRDERDRLRELVRQAQPHVCSLLCPSVKARHELWTHTKLCLNMQAATLTERG